MPELKEVFDRVNATRKEKKDINDTFREALSQSKPYQDVLDELRTLKAKEQQLKTAIRQDFVQEMEKIERLTMSIKGDIEMLSDMALTKMMKGETVEITDDFDVAYQPVFKVTFKKAM
ncbi:MAG: hypothetical protein WA001_00980 [Patescibacteria group bacterium]